MNKDNNKADLKRFIIKLVAVTFSIIVIINVTYNLIFAEKFEIINKLLSLDNKEMLPKIFPNLITTPSKHLSEIRTFEPAPSTKILSSLPKTLRNDDSSFSVLGLKYALALPPILNQFVFFNS